MASTSSLAFMLTFAICGPIKRINSQTGMTLNSTFHKSIFQEGNKIFLLMILCVKAACCLFVMLWYNCSLADTSMSLLMRTAGSPTENCGVKVFNKTLTLTLNLTLTLK